VCCQDGHDTSAALEVLPDYTGDHSAAASCRWLSFVCDDVNVAATALAELKRNAASRHHCPGSVQRDPDFSPRYLRFQFALLQRLPARFVWLRDLSGLSGALGG
jgi:hypothetical protein